ncbi:TBC1 domain family member 20 isoform X2 [Nematostella vectensis]|nr:TBC1 domain family member 20 isoform X2 [Nematostella vectensis]
MAGRGGSSRARQRRPLTDRGRHSLHQEQGIMAQMMHYMSEARLRGKIRRINEALEEDPVDVQTLCNLAMSCDGLITNDLRRRVWPKLLNANSLDISVTKNKKGSSETAQFQENKYWVQVNLDVDRSHRRFPKVPCIALWIAFAEMRVSRRKVLQSQLTNVIMRVICKHQNLHYYQGYHDIAVTLLLVVGEDLATALLEQLSLHQLRDFMEPTMEKTNKMLSFIHPIIQEADPELEDFLIRSEVGQMFALSWLITWYGHVIQDFDTIVRLYDFFLATHPLMPVYLAAALVIHRRDDVLLGECDMAFVHHSLSKIPSDFSSRVEELITSTKYLFEKYSPEKMAKAAERHLKESMALAQHTQFLYDLSDQRPDSILRRRRQQNSQLHAYQGGEPVLRDSTNPYVKLAVWTLTASLGTVALYVLGSAKRWI